MCARCARAVPPLSGRAAAGGGAGGWVGGWVGGWMGGWVGEGGGRQSLPGLVGVRGGGAPLQLAGLSAEELDRRAGPVPPLCAPPSAPLALTRPAARSRAGGPCPGLSPSSSRPPTPAPPPAPQTARHRLAVPATAAQGEREEAVQHRAAPPLRAGLARPRPPPLPIPPPPLPRCLLPPYHGGAARAGAGVRGRRRCTALERLPSHVCVCGGGGRVGRAGAGWSGGSGSGATRTSASASRQAPSPTPSPTPASGARGSASGPCPSRHPSPTHPPSSARGARPPRHPAGGRVARGLQ